MKDFYLDLFSSSSTDIYPNNTLSHFCNKSSVPLCLEDHMEVGLCEASFVASVNNVPHTKFTNFKIFDFLYKYPNENFYGQMYEFTLEPGFYETPQHLCDYINKKVWEKVTRLKDTVIFKFDTVVGKIVFSYPDENYFSFILMREMLVLMGVVEERKDVPEFQITLGSTKPSDGYMYHNVMRKFKDKDEYISVVPKTDKMTYPPLLDYLDSIYCYTDIIQEQITGDTKSSLLRVVALKSDPNKRVTRCFANPHYVPLRSRHIVAINIELRDSNGNFILFTSGRYTRIRLHFRKREQF